MSLAQRQFKIVCLMLMTFGVLSMIASTAASVMKITTAVGSVAGLMVGGLAAFYGFKSAMAANVPSAATEHGKTLGTVLVFAIIVGFVSVFGNLVGSKVFCATIAGILGLLALLCVVLCNRLAKEVDR